MASINFGIAVEPQGRHRFRTLNEGSHGVIVGDGGSHPTAILKVNPADSKDFDIQKIKVYCYATANNDAEQLMLSPHALRKKKSDINGTSIHLIEAEQSTPCEFSYTIKDCWIAKSIKQDTTRVLDKNINEYRNLGISHFLQEDKSAILNQKYIEYSSLGLPQKILEELKRNKTNNKRAIELVYLAFSMFSEYTNEWQTVFSKNILNLDPMQINMLCNPRVSMTAPDRMQIVLLVRDVELDYTLEVREFDADTKDNKWSDEVSSAFEVVQQNKALIYELPTHPNPEKRESINCLIKLKHRRSESNEVGIVYEDLNSHQTLKRPNSERNDTVNDTKKPCFATSELRMLGGHKVSKTIMTDAVAMTSMLLRSLTITPTTPKQHIKTDSEAVVIQKENVFKHLHKLGQTVKELSGKSETEIWNAFIIEDNAYRKDMHNTLGQDKVPVAAFHSIDCGSLYHDAIQVSEFFTVERIVNELESDKIYECIREQLGSFRDWRGRTLLHTAFIYEKFDFLKSLLNMRPDVLLVQDLHGNTPLHVAVQSRKSDWLEIIEYDDFYSAMEPASTDRISRLLRIYNNSNLTVLHSAIKKNCLPLLAMLLQHCKRCNIDACEIRVLGSGDSLMHLVEKMSRSKDHDNQAETFKAIILKYYPHAAEYVNYAGYNANGDYCEETSTECDSECELSS